MKKQINGYPPNTELRFDMVISNPVIAKIPFESIDKIWDAFFEAVTKEGLEAKGGVAPITEEEDE